MLAFLRSEFFQLSFQNLLHLSPNDFLSLSAFFSAFFSFPDISVAASKHVAQRKPSASLTSSAQGAAIFDGASKLAPVSLGAL